MAAPCLAASHLPPCFPLDMSLVVRPAPVSFHLGNGFLSLITERPDESGDEQPHVMLVQVACIVGRIPLQGVDQRKQVEKVEDCAGVA